jgi:quinol monooxygenase YgiN
MFARNVTFQIKPNQGQAFASKYQKDVLPILRQAPGFRDELTLLRNSNETVGITLWDNRAQLDAYTNNVDAQVIKLLEPMTSGTPDVRTYEVSSSTAHKIPVA